MKPVTGMDRDAIMIKTSLFRKIKPYLTPYKISYKKLMSAIERVLDDTRHSDENIPPETLPLIFSRVFDCDNILWIEPKTPAGNILPFDILATAHAMWNDAQRIAHKRGLDGVDAAEALTQAAYILTDRIVEGIAPEIRNVRKYLFVCFVRDLSRIALNAGGIRPHCRRKKKDLSDDGAFMNSLENAILCREILSAMPVNVRKAITLRYAIGCSCKETAKKVGISNNAARKAVSTGLRKTFGACMRELRVSGDVKIDQKMRKMR